MVYLKILKWGRIYRFSYPPRLNPPIHENGEIDEVPPWLCGGVRRPFAPRLLLLLPHVHLVVGSVSGVVGRELRQRRRAEEEEEERHVPDQQHFG